MSHCPDRFNKFHPMPNHSSVERRYKDSSPAASLRKTYIIALSLIALLALSSLLVTHLALNNHRNDSVIINLSGRQRMLSQFITKCAVMLELYRGDAEKSKEIHRQLADAYSLWLSRHLGLMNCNLDNAVGFDNSAEVRALLMKAKPHFEAMDKACRSIIQKSTGGDSSRFSQELALLLEHEQPYLRNMDEITFQYEKESRNKVSRIQFIEVSLFFVILLVLFLEAQFVFKPAARKIKEYMDIIQQNSRQSVIDLIALQEEERKRMAKDLHDSIGSSLAVMLLHLNQIEDSCPADFRPKLKSLGKQVNYLTANVRTVAEEMMPVTLERFGLEVALDEILAYSQQVFQGEIKVEMHIGKKYDPGIEINLYRIIQELLNNSIRHADATQIDISLISKDDQIQLNYQDDGMGFAPDFAPGRGIRNIETRVKALEADWTLRNRQPKGISAVLSFNCAVETAGTTLAADSLAPSN